MTHKKSKAALAARLVLGLIYTVFGLNGFLKFLPAPPLEGPAGAFIGALVATGYMIPLVKGIEVLGGVLLLSGRRIPLALLLLAPIQVNIFLFHLVLAPSGLVLPIVMLLLHLYLAWTEREVFAPVLGLRLPTSQTVVAPSEAVAAANTRAV